jgi:hypothetical protein
VTAPFGSGAGRWLFPLLLGGLLISAPVGMLGVAAATLLAAPGGKGDAGVPSSPCTELVDAEPVGTLTADQAANARSIVTAGRAAHVPDRGLVVALATALQESGLRNLDYGDRDSVGLFQQRAPWGTLADRTDPATSAHLFFAGGRDLDGAGPDGSEPGLLSITGWERLGITEAAQAVQRSAFPTAYAKWEPLATATVAAITGSSPVPCNDSPGAPTQECPAFQPAAAEQGLTPDLIAVLRCGSHTFPEVASWGCLAHGGHVQNSDHYTGRACDLMISDWQGTAGVGQGDRIGEYFQRNASVYGVSYIIWHARIWNADRAAEGWRAYRHPGGRTDPTALHMDHVHVSVRGNAGTYSWSDG